ncbi:MAG: NAD(P)-dependent oxidoreductase [Planctomycetia bacterium]|nr:NAD(P)-dependent oxidoreductase [Planctomycetia bacterium]
MDRNGDNSVLPRISWIGTGIMGNAMCGRLLSAGYSCTVFSRTRLKAENLLEAGAQWAESPSEAAEKADVVFTMVGYPADVESVILDPEKGVLSGMRHGQSGASRTRIVVDMTTSRPSLAVEIAKRAEEIGVQALDAPVSGGDIGAKNGTLSIMVGGSRAAFEALRPIWDILGSNIRHQGGPGMGQHTKMMNQILIAGNMLGVCEALRYGKEVGLDLNVALESVISGAAGSWSLSNLGPRILREDFAPGFKIRHFVKDLRIALDEAASTGLDIPGVCLAERLYSELIEAGFADAGTQSLVKWDGKG